MSDEPVEVVVHGAVVGVGLRMVALGRTRHYLPEHLMRAAERFTRSAQQIEEEHAGHWASPQVEEVIEFSLAAIVNAAMFVEAIGNEIGADAADGTSSRLLAGVDPVVVRRWSTWWNSAGGDSASPLGKLQMLLVLADCEPLNEGTNPFQSAHALMRLRNELVHYKPAWNAHDESLGIEKVLRGRFPTNGLLPPDSGVRWPWGFVGAGCARWSCDAARAVVNEVLERLSIGHRFGLPGADGSTA